MSSVLREGIAHCFERYDVILQCRRGFSSACQSYIAFRQQYSNESAIIELYGVAILQTYRIDSLQRAKNEKLLRKYRIAPRQG